MLAEAQSVRAYPAPFGDQRRAPARLPQPDHRGRARRGREATTTARSTAPPSSAGPAWRSSTTRWLRGMPGYKRVAVDSMGRVLGDDSEVAAQRRRHAGHLDRRQGAGGRREAAARRRSTTARKTYDEVTHRNYVADSGAVVVLDAQNGRVVAMASQPTYDPNQWVGGITSKQLERLYSAKADNPLLFRATQGQFAPGSTWKPLMTATALSNGFSPDTPAGLLERPAGRQPVVQELRVRVVRPDHRLRQGAADLLRHVLLPGRAAASGRSTAPTRARWTPRTRWSPAAKGFGMGSQTGIDIPGESSGRIADRHWKLSYWKAMKGYYCKVDKKGPATASSRSSRTSSASRATCTAQGDAVNFSIGQGDTLVTPLQLGPRLRGARQRRHALRAPRRQGGGLPDRQGDQEDPAEGAGPRQGEEGRAALRRRRAAGHARSRHHWPGSSSTSRWTRSGSAPRPARPRSTASRAPRGSRRTTKDYVV